MKTAWIVLAALAAVALVASDPALARVKRKKPHCVDRPYQFSWSFLWPGNPEPQPNGCAPAVYQYGKFIGQDPDPHIRQQLLRDPATGYSALNNN